MSVKVANSRFIEFSLVKYHQLFSGISNVVELGKRLTSVTETAQLMRQTDAVKEYGLILSNLPAKEYQLIGQYYLNWLACYAGKTVSPSVFENIFEQSRTYKAKALITLSGLAAAEGKFEDELRYQTEALKYSDLPTTLRTLCGIAVIKAKEGFHKQSLKELESLFPYIRYAGPYYYQYLNSLAVELGEVGRIEEAQNVCRITLASPSLFAYPEWRETWQDLALRGYKSRSVVSVPKLPLKKKSNNVVPIPVNNNPSFIQQECAGVVDLKAWRDKMVKEPNGEDENLDKMDFNELVVKLLQLTTHEELSEKKLRKVVKSAIKIIEEKD